MDDYNQRVGGFINDRYRYGGSNLPNDLIDGYTLAYIQDQILTDARGMHSLKEALYANRIAGVTISDIDELLALYW
jgi:hypothetical protein